MKKVFILLLLASCFIFIACPGGGGTKDGHDDHSHEEHEHHEGDGHNH